MGGDMYHWPTTEGEEEMSPIHAPVPEEREWQNPPEGVHQGVIYAVELREKVETKFGVKDKLVVKIQLNPESAGEATYEDKDGKTVTNPFMVQAFNNLSMFKGKQGASTLRKLVEAVSGLKFADNAEAAKFDLETLVGMNGMFHIIHTEPNADGKVYANIQSVMPLPKGTKLIAPVNVGNGKADDDDSLPF